MLDNKDPGVFPSFEQSSTKETFGKTKKFGSIEVQENLAGGYLSEKEKQVYSAGFDHLKNAVDLQKPWNKLEITNPLIVSGVVGYQPLVSNISLRQYHILSTSLPEDKYKFYGSWNPHIKQSEIVMVNLSAARLALGEENERSDEAMLSQIKETMKQGGKEATKMLGVLSGYPSQDINDFTEKYYSNSESGESFYELVEMKEYLSQGHLNNSFRTVESFNKITKVVLSAFDLFGKLMGERNPGKFAEGYGVYWTVTNENKETYEALQKLMEMDRTLGLRDYIRKINPLSM